MVNNGFVVEYLQKYEIIRYIKGYCIHSIHCIFLSDTIINSSQGRFEVKFQLLYHIPFNIYTANMWLHKSLLL